MARPGRLPTGFAVVETGIVVYGLKYKTLVSRKDNHKNHGKRSELSCYNMLRKKLKEVELLSKHDMHHWHVKYVYCP